MWPPYSPLPPVYKRKPTPGTPFIAPVLVSGGLDMSVVLTPCLPASVTTSTVAARVVNPLATSVATTFEDSHYRRIPYFSAVSISRGARLVSYMHETGLNVWRVLNIPSLSTVIDGRDISTDPELRIGWETVLEMELNVQTSLIASALSDDGQWLVVSDLYETKLFRLDKTVSRVPCRARKVLTPPSAHRGSKAKADSLANQRVRGTHLHFEYKRFLFDRRKLLRLHTRFKQNDLGLCIDVPDSRN